MYPYSQILLALRRKENLQADNRIGRKRVQETYVGMLGTTLG
jgi:hypothetical protein